MAERRATASKKTTKKATTKKSSKRSSGQNAEKAASKNRCVLTLELLTEPWQEHILEKRFNIVEHLKNRFIALEMKRLKRLRQTPQYRAITAELKVTDDAARRNELLKERSQLLVEAGFPPKPRENSKKDSKSDEEKSYPNCSRIFTDDMTKMQKHFAEHITAQISHKAANDVWIAFIKYLYDPKCKKISFHKRGTLKSVACKQIGNGMHYNDGIFRWNGGQVPNKISVSIPVEKPRTSYELEMLKKPIKYLRVVRKWVKTRYKYYLQFTLEGTAVNKLDKIAHGRVGLDIGPQSLAISSAYRAKLLQFAEELDVNESKKKQLMIRMDRSRRAMNPDNYNEDGTIRKPSRGHRLRWTYSKNYLELAGKLRELERKNADIRRYEHFRLANEILLSCGDEIYIEDMEFKGLQKRASETKRDKNGRYIRKKRFGRSLANKAPSMFQTILENKLKQYGGSYNRVNTRSFRASQYDHTLDDYRKCKLSERWKELSNGDHVQRDLYSAFLIMNSDPTLDQCDHKLCKKTYSNFKLLHDMEIERLRARKLEDPSIRYLSSFGI